MANATYCFNGHFVDAPDPTINTREARQHSHKRYIERMQSGKRAFCTKCSAETIHACINCKNEIELQESGDRPSYCGSCGKAYPWTESTLQAAQAYADEIENLTDDDKAMLKRSFPILTSDTAETPLAISRYKRLMEKAGPVASKAMWQIMTTIVTEGTKAAVRGKLHL